MHHRDVAVGGDAVVGVAQELRIVVGVALRVTAVFAGLLAGFFFPCSSAFATTFGPISVVDQLQNAQYVVRGSIMGSAWVEPEPRLQRPYTYWRLTVREQNLGNSLPVSIVIRQPGGEIGEIGYHVAGSAEFSARKKSIEAGRAAMKQALPQLKALLSP